MKNEYLQTFRRLAYGVMEEKEVGRYIKMDMKTGAVHARKAAVHAREGAHGPAADMYFNAGRNLRSAAKEAYRTGHETLGTKLHKAADKHFDRGDKHFQKHQASGGRWAPHDGWNRE